MTFFALFSLVDLIIFSIIFLAMLGSVWADDRSNLDALKWWVVFISLIVVAVMYWPSWTLSSVFDYLTSATFFKLLAAYIGIGIVYAVAKFLIKTRSVANTAGRMWNTWLADSAQDSDGTVVTNSYMFDQFRKNRSTMLPDTYPSSNIEYRIRQLISSLDDLCPFFRFSLDDGAVAYTSPRVRTVRSRLTDFLNTWIIFWPMYLLVNVLGDFIETFVNSISNLISNLTSGLTARIFDSKFNPKP